MAELSYYEALYGIVSDNDVEALVELVKSHKNWGAIMARLPSDIVVSLVDEIKRLREAAGGYKRIPEMESKP